MEKKQATHNTTRKKGFSSSKTWHSVKDSQCVGVTGARSAFAFRQLHTLDLCGHTSGQLLRCHCGSQPPPQLPLQGCFVTAARCSPLSLLHYLKCPTTTRPLPLLTQQRTSFKSHPPYRLHVRADFCTVSVHEQAPSPGPLSWVCPCSNTGQVQVAAVTPRESVVS